MRPLITLFLVGSQQFTDPTTVFASFLPFALYLPHHICHLLHTLLQLYHLLVCFPCLHGFLSLQTAFLRTMNDVKPSVFTPLSKSTCLLLFDDSPFQRLTTSLVRTPGLVLSSPGALVLSSSVDPTLRGSRRLFTRPQAFPKQDSQRHALKRCAQNSFYLKHTAPVAPMQGCGEMIHRDWLRHFHFCQLVPRWVSTETGSTAVHSTKSRNPLIVLPTSSTQSATWRSRKRSSQAFTRPQRQYFSGRTQKSEPFLHRWFMLPWVWPTMHPNTSRGHWKD